MSIHDRASVTPNFRETQAVAVAEAIAGLFCPLPPSDEMPGAVTVPDVSVFTRTLRTVIAGSQDARLVAVARRALDAWERQCTYRRARDFLENDGFAFGAQDAWRDQCLGLGNVVPLRTHAPAARPWHPLDAAGGVDLTEGDAR